MPQVTLSQPAGLVTYQMLERPTFCDVTFLCGPTKIPVQAHRCVLATHSDVLNAMFVASMRESQTKEIEIAEYEQPIVELMLELLYKGSADVSDAQLLPLYGLCHFYALKRLLEALDKSITEQLNDTNVLPIYAMGCLYGSNFPALEYLRQNAYRLFCDEEFQAENPLNAIQMCVLLQDDKLECDEQTVWMFAKSWAKKQTNAETEEMVAESPYAQALSKVVKAVRLVQLSSAILGAEIAPLEIVPPEVLVLALQKQQIATPITSLLSNERPRQYCLTQAMGNNNFNRTLRVPFPLKPLLLATPGANSRTFRWAVPASALTLDEVKATAYIPPSIFTFSLGYNSATDYLGVFVEPAVTPIAFGASFSLLQSDMSAFQKCFFRKRGGADGVARFLTLG